MNTITDYAHVPLPAGVEFYDGEWRQSPNGSHYRRFASKKFPVFDWLTVWTGGTQILDEGQVFVVRDIRVLGNTTSLMDSQALEFARALTDAAAYVAEMSDSDGMIER